MEKRTRLTIKKSIFEKGFDAIALLVFLWNIVNLISNWSAIPSIVPTHYNIVGEADAWGSKWQIFLPLAIGMILWIGLHFLEKYPEIHNYISLTEENRERQYKNSKLLLNFMKNEMLIFFSLFSTNDIRVVKGQESLMGVWTLPIFLIIIFGTLAFFIVRAIQMR